MERRLDPVDVVVVGSAAWAVPPSARGWRSGRRSLRIALPGARRLGRSGSECSPAASRGLAAGLALTDLGGVARIMRLKSAGPSARPADYAIDDTGSPIKPLMWSGVGGSSINWAAHFPRLHPSDFRTQTLDGVGDDWPFDYFDLEPYYHLNDAAMGVCGLAGQSRLSAEAGAGDAAAGARPPG